MRTLILASLLGGAAAWSTTALYADPADTNGDPATAAPADAAAEETAAPGDRPGDADRPPRDDDRPRGEFRRGRRGPDDERPFRGRGPDGDFGPRGGRGPDGDFGPPRDRDEDFGPPGERRGRPEGAGGDRPFPPGRGRDGFGGPRFGGPPRDFVPPLLHALDADGDRTISADEIAKAADALKTLDKNSDGKLTAEELRPDFARRGPDDADGPPRREARGPRFGRDGEDFGPRDGDGPPPEGRREFGRRGGDGPPHGESGEERRGFGPRGAGGDGEFRHGEGRRHGPPHGDRGRDGEHHRRRHDPDAGRGPRRGPPRDDADTTPESAPQEKGDAPADTKA